MAIEYLCSFGATISISAVTIAIIFTYDVDIWSALSQGKSLKHEALQEINHATCEELHEETTSSCPF